MSFGQPNLHYDKKTQRFILEGIEPKGKDENLWELYSHSPLRHATYTIRAAARFKAIADQTTKNLFHRVLVKSYKLPDKPLPSFLDPHQVEGVKWILTRSRSYLAHAPGAGKTVQAIVASLFTPHKGQTLILTPPTLTANWEREIFKFMAHTHSDHWPSVSILPDSSNQMHMGWKADFIIVPDSMITKAWVLPRLVSLPKKMIIIDEASRFKEPLAARTIALFGGMTKHFKSPGLIASSHHAVLLDGSPMPNRPMELWAPLYAMAPETIDFMSQKQFGFRYCGAEMDRFGRWEFKRASHEGELRQRIQKFFMHVVSEDKLSHPERLRSMVFMTENPMLPSIRDWERRFLPTLSSHSFSESDSKGDLASHRARLGETKIEWAAHYIGERARSGESVLVFCWHRGVALGLSDKLSKFKPGLVIGGVDAEKREEQFKLFRDKKIKIIIGNILAMGRGHNLQTADRVVFVEYSWTDEHNIQCEKRASRKGRDQDLHVKCDYLVIPDSLDEVVLSACFTKQERVKRIIG